MKATPLITLFRFLALWLVCSGGAAAAFGGGEAVRGAAARTPISSLGLDGVLADAHRLAASNGDRVVRVEGASMLPYFGDGAVLVVRSAAVDTLRVGAVVVYRNRFDELVAHRVESRTAEGWTVRGANNAERDSTLITAENLLGTVYVTFYSAPLATAAGAELIGSLIASTPVALAATAR